MIPACLSSSRGPDLVVVMMVAMPMLFVPAALVVASRNFKKQWDRALETTRHYQGVPGGGGMFSGKWIDLRMYGATGRLTALPGSKSRPTSTRIDFQISMPWRLRLTPQGYFMSLQKLFGAQDVEIGNPEFDEAFQIEAESAETARRILRREIRQALMAMRADNVTLDVRPGVVSVAVRRYLLSRPEAFEAFLKQVDDLVGALREQESGGRDVKVIETKSAPGTCMTCGTPLDKTTVTCTKCRTQQHLDCWNYVGGCATFGCGGKRFLK